MGFSSGDFPTSQYGINLAYSVDPGGPYCPVLTEDGKDLADFGSGIRERYGLSWGPGRPDFFKDSAGRWWIAFHAVDTAEVPDQDYSVWPVDLNRFHRNIYLAPIQISLDRDGTPRIAIMDDGRIAKNWL
jgi:hypothetical protein